MLEKIIYRNHSGEEIKSAEGGIYVNENDLRDHEWSHLESSGKIVEFYRGIVKKTIPLIVIADGDAEGVRIKNELLSIAEKDVISVKPGKIIIGDFYMTGYITESKKSKYLYSNKYTEYNLKFVSDNPFWITESTIIYERKSRPETGFLDYPYDYRYDYTPNLNSVFLENTEVAPCDIKMVIQGPCLNPEICIGENKHQVMTELSSYEYIVLNTSERTAYKVSYNGAISNVWGSLNRDYDNFKKVPGGKHIVTTNGNFKVQITAYISRSEPRWI